MKEKGEELAKLVDKEQQQLKEKPLEDMKGEGNAKELLVLLVQHSLIGHYWHQSTIISIIILLKNFLNTPHFVFLHCQ